MMRLAAARNYAGNLPGRLSITPMVAPPAACYLHRVNFHHTMKITRILYTLAAVLSLGLAVFANARVATAAPVSAHSSFKVGDDNTDLLPDFPPDDSGSGGGGDSGH